MIVFLFVYYSNAPCTSIGDISACAIRHIWKFISIDWYVVWIANHCTGSCSLMAKQAYEVKGNLKLTNMYAIYGRVYTFREFNKYWSG